MPKINYLDSSGTERSIELGAEPVLIGRAPEFYGPGKTQSVTNALVIDNLKAGKKPRVPVRDDKLRTLVWTPDASRALAALANTPDAFGQTWHLPCCDERLTYRHAGRDFRLTDVAGEVIPGLLA